ncbi:MAG TPA: DUF4388 domain-containing protein [Candidatus Deferrimicrobiaceae bacterium]
MQGNIADFSIPEIFQLVSSQGKSGSLSISGNDRITIFLFSEGLIVDVQPDRREPRSLLGTMLRDAGFLTDSDLKRFLDAQGGGGKKIGELLVEKGKISREVLARYLALQVRECLFDVLSLQDGEYRFEGFAVRSPPGGGEPFRPDVLMMEGMQFLDEYPLFRGKLPQGPYRVSRRKGEKVDANVLSAEERAVWKALEFSDDPDRVFRKACLTGFEGCKGLASLQERGLVEVGAVVPDREDPALRLRREFSLRRLLDMALVVLWAGGAAAVAVRFYRSLLTPSAAELFAEWTRFF